MKRRTLLAAAAGSLVAPRLASAQEMNVTEIVNLWAQMVATQDQTIADQIIADDYAPLYPAKSMLPGKEAYKQRLAAQSRIPFNDPIWTVISVARNGEYTHALMEITGTGGSNSQNYPIRVPRFAVFKIVDNQITGGAGLLDEGLLFEQLAG